MNEKQLAYFKGKLMDWKNELINQSQETLLNLIELTNMKLYTI